MSEAEFTNQHKGLSDLLRATEKETLQRHLETMQLIDKCNLETDKKLEDWRLELEDPNSEYNQQIAYIKTQRKFIGYCLATMTVCAGILLAAKVGPYIIEAIHKYFNM